MPDPEITESPDADESERLITTLSLSPITKQQLKLLKKQRGVASMAAVVERLADEAVRNVRIDVTVPQLVALMSHREHKEEPLPMVVMRALEAQGFFKPKVEEEVV